MGRDKLCFVFLGEKRQFNFDMVAVIDCETKVVNSFGEGFEAVDQLSDLQ